MSDAIIRRASRDDVDALGRLGAMLLTAHHEFDRERFIAPGEQTESGYGWFLGSQIRHDDAVVFVAERDGRVVGYVYAGIEPHSWKELRDEAGFIHDIAVEADERRSGVATRLVNAAVEWLRERGVPRVILWTAERNAIAQQLFERLGFRRTMIEMTREL